MLIYLVPIVFNISPGTLKSAHSAVRCPSIPAPSERMFRANGSRCVQLGSWEQSLEIPKRRTGAVMLRLLGWMGSRWHEDLVPEGRRQSLCHHQAELLLGAKAEEQLDVLGFR